MIYSPLVFLIAQMWENNSERYILLNKLNDTSHALTCLKNLGIRLDI